MRFNTLVFALILAGCVSPVWACSQHGTGAGHVDWLATGNSGGIVQGLLSLETTLVAPTSPTTCTAGIGLGSLADPLPGGFNVTGMDIVVINATTGSRTPLSAFSFASNSVTTSGLAAGSGSSVLPNTNPLFDGSTWWGFSSAVDPFVPPVLGPDEFTAFQFAVEVPAAMLPLVRDAQFAGGEGQPDGTPIFDRAHPVQYFAAANPAVEFVPEPSTVGLALFAGAALALARLRRSLRCRARPIATLD